MKFINKVVRKLEHWYFISIRRDKVQYAKRLGVSVGQNVRIMPDPYTAFGTEPYLITIGDNVEITDRVQFTTHDGALWVIRNIDERYKNADIFKPIRIGNNVFIGNDTYVLPGVTIGNNVIIGAHSVITKDIPDNCVYAGVPARYISTIEDYITKIGTNFVETKNMDQDEKKQFLLKKYNWDEE